MSKRFWLAMCSLGIVLILIALISVFYLLRMTHRKHINLAPQSFHSPQEKALWTFLSNWMMCPDGGVYTNLKPAKQTESNPGVGHVVLSESVGLMLEYAVEAHDQPLFDHEKNLLKDKFIKGSILQWVIPMPAKTPTNSSVDDLRIIGALMIGANQFNEPTTQQLALQLAENLYSTNALDGFLADDNSEKAASSGVTVTPPYANVRTLAMLCKSLPEYDRIYQNEKKFLTESLLSSGLYAYQYFPQEHLFRQTSTGQPMLDTNLAEQFVAAIDAEQAGLSTKPFTSHLEKLMNQNTGKIFTRIDQKGMFVSKDESPAVYALATRYFSAVGESKYAQICLKRLLALETKSGNYTGGFVDLQTLQAFSFDQLQALITYRGVE
jgi:hypothetical protein